MKTITRFNDVHELLKEHVKVYKTFGITDEELKKPADEIDILSLVDDKNLSIAVSRAAAAYLIAGIAPYACIAVGEKLYFVGLAKLFHEFLFIDLRDYTNSMLALAKCIKDETARYMMMSKDTRDIN